jgi:hypothetical protein
MAGMREKYGRGVAGLPFGMRVAVTVAMCLPSAFWFATSLVTGPPWTALTLAIGVLLAAPLYLLLPALWQPSEEHLRAEWYERRLQKNLEVALGTRELDPRVDLDPHRPIPKRW